MDGNPANLNTPKRKKRSWVWEYFDKDTGSCSVNNCGAKFNVWNGTNSMKTHLQSVHAILPGNDQPCYKKQKITNVDLEKSL